MDWMNIRSKEGNILCPTSNPLPRSAVDVVRRR